MGEHVAQLSAMPTQAMQSPSSMYNEIMDIIEYVKGIADNGMTELETALNQYDTSLNDFNIGVLPAAPTPPVLSYDFEQGTYGSDTWKAWCDQILYDVENPSHGLSKASYDAIIAMNNELWRAGMTQETNRFKASMNSFGIKEDIQVLAGQEVDGQLLAKERDLQNQIIIKNFDMAIRNKEFNMHQLNEIEKLSQALFNKAEAIGLEAAKGINEHLVAVYEASVLAFNAQWSALDVRVKAYVAQAGYLSQLAGARSSVAMQKVASALGALNASLGHGYTGSVSHGISREASQSISNSLSEKHGYTHIVAP